MTNIINNRQLKISLTTITVVLLLSVVSISSNNFDGYQTSAAQKTNSSTVQTFSAKGYTGQTFFLPSGIPFASPSSNSQFNLLPPVGSIIVGNWSFSVNGGSLQDFNWNVQHLTLNGKINGTFSITGVSNSTGEVQPVTTIKNIQLSKSNSTIFKANADLNFNNKTAFKGVPIVLSLLNGKLINLSIDPAKTDGVFTTPLFGIITTLTY